MLESKKTHYQTLAEILAEKLKNGEMTLAEVRKELQKQNNSIII